MIFARDSAGGGLAVGWESVAAAAARLDGVALRAPVLTSAALDEMAEVNLFFKCENLQHIGAFKFRGAYNAMVQLNEEQRQRGVLTFSSGNHGQAIARCGRMLGIQTVVIMPSSAPALKINNTRKDGAEVILFDPDREVREEIAQRLMHERGMTLIPPFDHPHVIAGQGTVVKELIEECGALETIYIPVGGGGLISGCAIAAHELAPACEIIGVEPDDADDGARSLSSGTLQICEHPMTIADGARTRSLGNLTFPIIRRHVRHIVTAGDAELMRAMVLLKRHLDIVVEPTGALAVAAALAGRGLFPHHRRVGVVISGGNVDPDFFAKLIG